MTDAPAVEYAPVFTIHEGVRNISVDYDPAENRVHVRVNSWTTDLERIADLEQKIVELSTRLRTIYWMDAMNDGATDEQAQVEADTRLNAPLSLGPSK